MAPPPRTLQLALYSGVGLFSTMAVANFFSIKARGDPSFCG